MKIVIPGGSGHVGTVLARALRGRGTTSLGERDGQIRPPFAGLMWNKATIEEWGRKCVINFGGRSVDDGDTAALAGRL